MKSKPQDYDSQYQMSYQINTLTSSSLDCLDCFIADIRGPCKEHETQHFQGDVSALTSTSQAQLLGTYSVEDSAHTQEPQEQPIPQVTELPNNPTNPRSAKKDNIAHKRLSKILQDCYRVLVGSKVPPEVSQYKYKGNYFLMIITCLEKEGKLQQVVEFFEKKMEGFTVRIEKEYEGQPLYLNHLKTLIKRHIEALQVFCTQNRPVEACLKILYDYENMRQKNHFKVAVSEIKELRAELGLP